MGRRHRSNKNNYWVLIIIIVLIGVIWAYNSGNLAINLPSVSNSSSKTSDCEKEAEKLVPITIQINWLLMSAHGDEEGHDIFGVIFKDGTYGEYNIFKNYCRIGSKPGEKEQACYIEGPNIKYRKKVVKNGTIIGYNEFELDNIVLIAPPLIDTGRGYSQRDSNYLVHSYEIKNCKWFEEIKVEKIEEYSKITEDYYQKKLELTKNWTSEDSCNICYSIFGKENVVGCGGIPKNDYTSCTTGVETPLSSTNHYIDIFYLKEISKEEVERRREIWIKFYEEREEK